MKRILLIALFGYAATVSGQVAIRSQDGFGTNTTLKTPHMISDVDFGGFSILRTASIGSVNDDSRFYLTPDSNFGIHNGEDVGVGADINLVSDNGAVIISPSLGIGTTTPGSDIDIVSTDPAHSPFIHLTYAQGGTGNVSCGVQFFNENGLNGDFSATANDYTPSGVIQPNQCVIFAYQEGGLLLGAWDGGSLGPIVFSTGAARNEAGRFTPTGQFLVGTTIDDGTGALMQSVGAISAFGSYWAGGLQGVNGTAVDGSTITGGLVTQLGSIVSNTNTSVLIQTNFITMTGATYYTNTTGRLLEVSAGVIQTTASILGMVQLSLEIPTQITNRATVITAIGTVANSITNATLSGFVPIGGTYRYINTSVGAGDSATASGGQIVKLP